MIFFIRKILKFFEVDYTLVIYLSSRIWSVFSGPLTIFFIYKYLEPKLQGFYYTFSSLVGLQIFFELAFSTVIIQFASHEWSNLNFDDQGYIIGEKTNLSRLKSLFQLTVRWYLVVSILFLAIVSIIGVLFFSKSHYEGLNIWLFPWLVLVALSALQLFLLPIISILEGCNQLKTLYKYRFIQGVLGSIAFCILLGLKAKLWASLAQPVFLLLCNLALLIKYKNFIKSIYRTKQTDVINWKEEVLPMQSRLALAGLVNYFSFSLFNPVMFHYYGPVVAGQMGLTWQIVGAIQNIGIAWIQIKIPSFGILIAKKEYKSLDKIWFRNSIKSFFVLMFVVSLFSSLLIILKLNHIKILDRLLPIKEVVVFSLATIFFHITLCEAAYLRAHKKEVLTGMSVVGSLLIGLCVWFYGSKFGPIGAVSSYLIINAIVIMPWTTSIFYEYRREWHAEA
ncbi:MAG: hypothetical protein HQM15_00405 [Deltaproteobacteria bacterium]|nr:hypothetical protein [Deltaproteobacteria bacterium]